MSQVPVEWQPRKGAPLRRFTPRAASPAIDFYQAAIVAGNRENPGKFCC
jgi:hypothetical protein